VVVSWVLLGTVRVYAKLGNGRSGRHVPVSHEADFESYATSSFKMDAGYLESVESCQRGMSCALVNITLGDGIS
jgi:hypothetical protein